jgi:Arc/MetJ family transcription regulator
MRTNIVIDEKLMQETLRLTGLKTKREAVELGLCTLVRLRKQGHTQVRRPQRRQSNSRTASCTGHAPSHRALDSTGRAGSR